jgi:uncharacterized protein (TIGR02271 family)
MRAQSIISNLLTIVIMANTVVGIFENESDAQQAQNYLLANGFADGDVDIKTASYMSDTESAQFTDAQEDHSGRIGSFFKALFDDDEEETRRYTEAGRRGTIVTVHAVSNDEAEAAAAVLDQFGAIDLTENGVDYTPGTAYEQPLTDAEFVADNPPASLPVIEEELQVGKREIETGGVRLRSRIIERPVQQSVRLRQEQVVVNRVPVDRAASEADFDTFKEGTIEMQEFAEIPVVSKEARVVEEVNLSKTVEEHDEVIHDTVRHTEVDVEDTTDEEKLRKSGLDL